jgi:serine phosphatase RsbU (regulator of sigma subunit)
MLPARELGGDFYDVFSLPDGRLGLLVADVSGKGVAAAFFMAVSRTVLMDVAADGGAPHEVLARANDMLCLRNPKELFITVCYVVFDPATGALEYASGGHPPPLVRREDGRVDVLPACHDIVLAVMPEMPYRTLHASLGSGDTMVLFTDGITEAFSGDGQRRMFGVERLDEALRATNGRPDEIVESIHRSLFAHTQARTRADDQTLVALQYVGPDRCLYPPVRAGV